ncbi:hypothetical protein PPYR_10390 [Photinus pyralis]|uniref:Uncharacterized protein n=1 Tax=Photinus pyralis TaxID=7054 RepID=A0A5N4AGA2_PHOPY|nr:uncharacterized protein LOC116174207 isoform X1 [Photinus pyralis]KAB0796329.1 hypothetical protein PPYR_10390 [Photinus pyralis]
MYKVVGVLLLISSLSGNLAQTSKLAQVKFTFNRYPYDSSGPQWRFVNRDYINPPPFHRSGKFDVIVPALLPIQPSGNVIFGSSGNGKVGFRSAPAFPTENQRFNTFSCLRSIASGRTGKV